MGEAPHVRLQLAVLRLQPPPARARLRQQPTAGVPPHHRRPPDPDDARGVETDAEETRRLRDQKVRVAWRRRFVYPGVIPSGDSWVG